jgi:hypothetical protein
MVESTGATTVPLATEIQDDLAELDFTPITDEESVNLEDRTYLLGVHVDAVRPT